jgi:hypothetical protein
MNDSLGSRSTSRIAFYTAGASEQHFGMVHQAMRKALEAKYPGHHQTDNEPERPRQRRSGSVRKVYTASGVADAIVDGGRAARLFSDRGGSVEVASISMVGDEEAGVPIGEDEDVD